jgi:beta-1,4-mannooligosaccharide/beta-1,4-mannosyl-N-acetylglucosamine phosphorylase
MSVDTGGRTRDRRTIIGEPMPNIPWEQKPAGYPHAVWRYSRNPIIPRDLYPGANSIFNSAVVPYKGSFAGVFRCDSTTRLQELHFGFSEDGINWQIDPNTCPYVAEPDLPEVRQWDYSYDPRVIWIEDRYYVMWCHGYHGPTIGLGWTTDFKTLHKMENVLLPFNRNGVLFPRKIGGKYMMLSRPCDNGHTPFGDIFLSSSPDLVHWGEHRHVMGTRSGWEGTKIGAGPVPIETTDGWLLIYHGVLTSCNGFVYHCGAALLDLDQPWNVLHRPEPYLMSPQRLYECVGDVPNVVFPCAALADAATGRLAIYYGAADTVTCLAFAQIDEMIAWMKAN